MTHTINHHKRTLLIAAAALAVLALLLVFGDPMHALKVAGFGSDKTPEGAGGLKKLVDELVGSIKWVIFTCITLAISVGGTLMLFGHSRAQDHLIRVGAGIVVVLFLAPATLA